MFWWFSTKSMSLRPFPLAHECALNLVTAGLKHCLWPTWTLMTGHVLNSRCIHVHLFIIIDATCMGYVEGDDIHVEEATCKSQSAYYFVSWLPINHLFLYVSHCKIVPHSCTLQKVLLISFTISKQSGTGKFSDLQFHDLNFQSVVCILCLGVYPWSCLEFSCDFLCVCVQRSNVDIDSGAPNLEPLLTSMTNRRSVEPSALLSTAKGIWPWLVIQSFRMNFIRLNGFNDILSM